MTFDKWLAEIDALADAAGGRGKDGRTYTERTGPACWRELFDDGFSPREAFDEDTQAGGE